MVGLLYCAKINDSVTLANLNGQNLVQITHLVHTMHVFKCMAS